MPLTIVLVSIPDRLACGTERGESNSFAKRPSIVAEISEEEAPCAASAHLSSPALKLL